MQKKRNLSRLQTPASQLTLASLLCAVYGILCLLDVWTAHAILDFFPFVMAMPAMVLFMRMSKKMAWAGAGAMMVLSFVLGDLQSWIALPPYVLAGALCGAGIVRHHSWLRILIEGTLLLGVSALVQVYVFAGIFGFERAQVVKETAWLSSWISADCLILVLGLFMGFLQALLLILLGYALAVRLPQYFEKPETLQLRLPAKKWAVVFLVAALLFLAGCTVVKYPIELTGMRDLITVLTGGLYAMMVYAAWVQLMQTGRLIRCVSVIRFLWMLVMWIFPLNLPFALYGVFVLLRQDK